MPPTPQPKTPSPLTIVVCESVPTSESGYAAGRAIGRAVANHARQIFQIHLVADAGVRRHYLKISKRLLSPAQKFDNAPRCAETPVAH